MCFVIFNFVLSNNCFYGSFLLFYMQDWFLITFIDICRIDIETQTRQMSIPNKSFLFHSKGKRQIGRENTEMLSWHHSVDSGDYKSSYKKLSGSPSCDLPLYSTPPSPHYCRRIFPLKYIVSHPRHPLIPSVLYPQHAARPF